MTTTTGRSRVRRRHLIAALVLVACSIASSSLTALAAPGAAHHIQTNGSGPLIVFRQNGQITGQLQLPNPGDSIDLTVQQPGCVNGVENPPIIALLEQNGAPLTLPKRLGGVARPALVPCAMGVAAAMFDVIPWRRWGVPWGVCVTIFGKIWKCYSWLDLWRMGKSVYERFKKWLKDHGLLSLNLYLLGGNTVAQAYYVPAGSKQASSQTIPVPPGTNEVDYMSPGTPGA
jgi:hypothetical protein